MKWEYLSGAMADFVDGHSGYVFISAIINEDHRITLNELGDRGWELVTIVDHIAYFKRLGKNSKYVELSLPENTCVRCGTKENVIDFGEDVNLCIDGGLARCLCATCSKQVINGLKKFLVSAPVELTPKEQELEDYFKNND
jgi:hypothetical protein